MAGLLEVEVFAAKPKAEWIDALSRKRAYKVDTVLVLLKRDELKKLCEMSMLSSAGRDKACLINRLLGKEHPAEDEIREQSKKVSQETTTRPELDF